MYASIVMPTYNRRKILEQTITALLKQTVPSTKYEIIVVDDCSKDTTAEYMAEIIKIKPSVKFIQHHENKGRVATRNDGLKAASGDIVIFLDDDNVPEIDFIEEHLKYYESNSNAKIAVMGNVNYAPEVIGNSNFAKFMQSRYLGNRSGKERSGVDYHDLPARCLGTLNCSMRRVDVIEVGMFDNDFRYYGGEDEYLGQCLKEKGVRLIFGEGARTLHYDILSLPRYKQKMLESAKFGLRILKNKSPQYFESTHVKYLPPPSMKKDNLQRLMVKIFIRAILNNLTIYCIEKWLTITDHVSSLYSSSLFRMVLAGWIIQGQKFEHNNDVFVKYEAALPDKN